jgi:hypothetical protein
LGALEDRRPSSTCRPSQPRLRQRPRGTRLIYHQVHARISKPAQTPQARRLIDAPREGGFGTAPSIHGPAADRAQETLNARSQYSNSEDDGTAQHRINQYLVKQEIGRGSFGAVHLAVDQYGQEYVRATRDEALAVLTHWTGRQGVLQVSSAETRPVEPPPPARQPSARPPCRNRLQLAAA